MPDWTRMLVQDIALRPITCHWTRGRFTCQAWVRPGSTLLTPLLAVMQRRSLTTCHFQPGQRDSRLTMPLSFAAYLIEWRSQAISPDLREHTLVFVMSGPPWRDDDTPVETHEDLWELMGYPRLEAALEAEAAAPPLVRKQRRDAGQPRKRKGVSVTH